MVSFLLVEVVLIIVQLWRADVEPEFRTGAFIQPYANVPEAMGIQCTFQPRRIAKEKPFHKNKGGRPQWAPVRLAGDNDLADVLQSVLIEGVTIGEAGDLQVDGLLVVVLGLIGADLALHIKAAYLAGDTQEALLLC